MKKASLSPELVVTVILALLFLGSVGGVLVTKIREGTEKGYDKALCQQSVLLNSKARIPVLKGQQIELSCPTRYVTFTKEALVTETLGAEQKAKVKCGDLSTPQQRECYLTKANEKMASLLFDCWDQFAAGRVQVLDVWSEETQCVLCARTEFSPEVQQAFSLGPLPLGFSEYASTDPALDFTLDNYLRSHNPPLHSISYYEFLLDPVDAIRPPVYDHRMDEPYAVVFLAANEHQLKALGEVVWEGIKEQFLGLTASREGEEITYANILEFMPYSEVAQRCGSLE